MNTLTVAGFALCCVALMSCATSIHPLPNAWTISTGTLGGIAGSADGFSMTDAGDIYHWRGSIMNHQAGKKVGSVGADSANAWRARLDAAGFWESTLSAPSNMTVFIEVNTVDQRHFVQWGGAPAPAEAAAMAAWATGFSKACSSQIPLD